MKDVNTIKSEIEDANKEFVRYFAAGDAEGLSGLYSKDAKFMMNGAPAIVGRSNVQTALSGIMNSGVTRVGLKTVDVWGNDDFITEEGELSLFAGDTEVDSGKYLVLWKKDDGQWRLFRDIFNSNLPANS